MEDPSIHSHRHAPALHEQDCHSDPGPPGVARANVERATDELSAVAHGPEPHADGADRGMDTVAIVFDCQRSDAAF